MKAIILAAGRGSRLNKYTEDTPKGMLEVFEKPILQHQVENFKNAGITDISIVTGYCADKFNLKNVNYYHNEKYATTNMVESLFCALEKLEGELIIAYADIVFSKIVLQTVLDNAVDIGVVADKSWEEYWKLRYGRIDFDIESFSVNDKDEIQGLGADVEDIKEIDGRYVGLIKLSEKGVAIFKEKYQEYKSAFSGKPWIGGRIFEQAYMTDFLQSLIDSNHMVKPIWVNGGWIEFDTNEDYELMENNRSTFKYIFE